MLLPLRKHALCVSTIQSGPSKESSDYLWQSSTHGSNIFRQTKTKRLSLHLVFSFWCAVEYVKITFPDDIDEDIRSIRELLADADKKELSK